MKETKTDIRPWYREPWPWVAIAIPAAAVIMGITTLVIAVKNPDPIIVDQPAYEQIRSDLKAQETPAGEPAPDESDDGAN